MGIDRLVMFLTDNFVSCYLNKRLTDTNAIQSIKEVLTFPFMKDVVEEKPKTAAEVVDVTPKPEEGIRKWN
jgi:lysyl-tRNA synthetase class 2